MLFEIYALILIKPQSKILHFPLPFSLAKFFLLRPIVSYVRPYNVVFMYVSAPQRTYHHF
jgi:hypothetical protein